MTLELEPLHPLFAAQASGIDLRAPLAAEAVRAIERAMDQYAVLLFRGQPLTQEEQLAFAKSFGPLDLGLKKATRAAANLTGYDEIIDISNVDAQGKVYERSHRKMVSNLANQLWHSDSSFQKPPARYSILHAVVVPATGGETEFADLRAAYDALPPEMKPRLEGLHAPHFALHSRLWLGEKYSQAELDAIPPAEWPLVRVHPGSKRRLLWVGVHATHVKEMAFAEGRMLLTELLEHATQREFVYRHLWQPGDSVMWDNRAVIHRGRPFDLSRHRELRRTSTEDV
ncbi:MAG TPA: TauD/TfdA family dioxygenase [Burkholderiales bacterium]|jgi:alpha-ketoglutarate-dependent 2,4-dichlorophenoxyacetate dioxygenase|nr:TauD/TfdA family dioxygenase [Burkholderiales bacterium]